MSLSFFLAWKDAQVIPKSLRRNCSPSLPKGAHISPPLRYQNGNMSPGDDSAVMMPMSCCVQLWFHPVASTSAGVSPAVRQ